jgi:hypothetical protein
MNRHFAIAGRVFAVLLAAWVTPYVSAQEKPARSIVEENKREGTTDWLLFNYDQVVPGRDEVWKREKGVEGYCSHATIRAGETV